MPPLVFFHGALSLIDEYRPLLDALEALAPVRPFAGPGHGAPLGHPLEMREWVEAAVTFVHDTGPCALVGHSAGGHVALHVAARDPEVQAVICLDSPLRVNRRLLSTPEAVEYLESLATDPRLADAAHHLGAQDLDAFFSGFDEDALAFDVDCPVLIIGADPERGSLLTEEDVERARARLPQVRIERLGGVGHMLGIDNGGVERLKMLIDPFLDQVIG